MKLKEKEPRNLRSALTLVMKFEVLHKSMAEQKANQKSRQIRATLAGDKDEKVKSQHHEDSLSQQPRRNIVNKDNLLNRSVQPKDKKKYRNSNCSRNKHCTCLQHGHGGRTWIASLRQHVDQSVDRLASMIRDTVSLHVAPSSSPHPLFSTTSPTATQSPVQSANLLTATCQVNGRWRILTPHRIETLATATKFRTIDYVRGRTP